PRGGPDRGDGAGAGAEDPGGVRDRPGGAAGARGPGPAADRDARDPGPGVPAGRGVRGVLHEDRPVRGGAGGGHRGAAVRGAVTAEPAAGTRRETSRRAPTAAAMPAVRPSASAAVKPTAGAPAATAVSAASRITAASADSQRRRAQNAVGATRAATHPALSR